MSCVLILLLANTLGLTLSPARRRQIYAGQVGYKLFFALTFLKTVLRRQHAQDTPEFLGVYSRQLSQLVDMQSGGLSVQIVSDLGGRDDLQNRRLLELKTPQVAKTQCSAPRP